MTNNQRRTAFTESTAWLVSVDFSTMNVTITFSLVYNENVPHLFYTVGVEWYLMGKTEIRIAIAILRVWWITCNMQNDVNLIAFEHGYEHDYEWTSSTRFPVTVYSFGNVSLFGRPPSARPTWIVKSITLPISERWYCDSSRVPLARTYFKWSWWKSNASHFVSCNSFEALLLCWASHSSTIFEKKGFGLSLADSRALRIRTLSSFK